MARVSNKSTYNDPVGVLEELLEHDIALDTLVVMLSMIQRKLDDVDDDWDTEPETPPENLGVTITHFQLQPEDFEDYDDE